MMSDVGIKAYFRNHSTRKSTCTRLFQKGVDPQLIKEQKGYKSEAIIRYKKSIMEMKKQVSDMLSVLPHQMEEIRNKEDPILEKECQSEEKK